MFEDAVLTGARCGSLFVGDIHGIKPDAIAFGKAFHVAGVVVQKKGKKGYQHWPCTVSKLGFMKTSFGLKVIFKTLFERVQLFTKDSGSLFQRQLAIGKKIINGINNKKTKSARGLGCLINFDQNKFQSTVSYSYDRLLPTFDLTDKDVDKLLSKIALR